VTLLNPTVFNLQENGNGTITVSVTNTASTAVAYSGLVVDNGAPISDYDAADFQPDMGLGSPVSLLLPSSGILAANSTTNVATFTPSALGYEAESITVDGAILALGEAEDTAFPAVPEPSSLILVLSSLGCLTAYRCRSLRRRA
jgi:hypothetical protein